MESHDWDRYFGRQFSNPLSSECCYLRTQLKERAPFAKASNFKVTDISGGFPKTHVVKDATEGIFAKQPHKGVRIVSLAGNRTTSPLNITSSLAAQLLERHNVRPEYLRILLFFGGTPLESEARNSYVSFHNGDDGEFCFSYRLVYFERNDDDGWVPRQIGVYHHQYSRAKGSGGLFIVASGTRQTEFLWTLEDALIPAPAGASNAAAKNLESNPWSFHTALLSCYVDSWRDYFRHLGSRYSSIGDRAMGTKGLQVDDETIRDVKTLRHLYDLSLFGGAGCAGNAEIARTLASQQVLIPPNEASSLDATADMLQSLAESCGVLQKKIKNATDLVGYLIAFYYQVVTTRLEGEVRDVTARMVTLTEENRDLTRQLHELAQGTSEMTKRLRDLTQNTASDGAIVSVITVVSAVYLPGSFVASIFGMNFFNFDENARRISISPDFWIFVVLWIALMIFTAVVFAEIYRMKRRDVSWLWKRLGGGVSAAKVGETV